MTERICEKNPLWKGGRHKDGHGYIHLRRRTVSGEKKFGYIFEHTKVMQQKLGRKLCKGETVHHKNGIRDDNRPANLELWTSNHPIGSRVKDLVSWAKKILKQYAPKDLK